MMTEDLVRIAFDAPLTAAVLQDCLQELGMSREALEYAFAMEVASGYRDGRYKWPDADAAMNQLMAAAVRDGHALSGVAFDVFLAFDEGEYIHLGDEAIDGEPRTRRMLDDILPSAGA